MRTTIILALTLLACQLPARHAAGRAPNLPRPLPGPLRRPPADCPADCPDGCGFGGFAPCPPPATAWATPTTRSGNGGYDVLHYTLDLAVDMQSGAISGTAQLAMRAISDLRAFNLDFRGFDIQSITVADQPATYRRTAHELTIAPAMPIRHVATFTTTIAYAGVPQTTIPEAIPIPIGWNRYADGVYVVSEPSGAAAWYPVNDHPRDKATYTFRITVAKPYVVAANGLLRDTIDNGDTRTYVWEASDLLASYLATVSIGRFVEQTEQGPNGLPIRNFFPPSVAENAREVFAPTATMIDYFDDLFGPYPSRHMAWRSPTRTWASRSRRRRSRCLVATWPARGPSRPSRRWRTSWRTSGSATA